MAEKNTDDLRAFNSALNAGRSQCPICGRRWTVTPADDCLVPACGHYGDDPMHGDRPCEECGLDHALSCPELAGSTDERSEVSERHSGPVLPGA